MGAFKSSFCGCIGVGVAILALLIVCGVVSGVLSGLAK